MILGCTMGVGYHRELPRVMQEDTMGGTAMKYHGYHWGYHRCHGGYSVGIPRVILGEIPRGGSRGNTTSWVVQWGYSGEIIWVSWVDHGEIPRVSLGEGTGKYHGYYTTGY